MKNGEILAVGGALVGVGLILTSMPRISVEPGRVAVGETTILTIRIGGFAPNDSVLIVSSDDGSQIALQTDASGNATTFVGINYSAPGTYTITAAGTGGKTATANMTAF